MYDENNDHFYSFFQWKWAKVERNCISWFCLTVRRGAHEIGQVFIKKQPLFHFLEEPKMLKSLMYFRFFSEKLCIKVGVILENVGIFKGKLGMSYLEKLVITKYTKFIIFAHFLWWKKRAPNDHKLGVPFWGGDTGDTRCGLVDQVAPFFRKTSIFVYQLITFCNIIFEKIASFRVL